MSTHGGKNPFMSLNFMNRPMEGLFLFFLVSVTFITIVEAIKSLQNSDDTVEEVGGFSDFGMGGGIVLIALGGIGLLASLYYVYRQYVDSRRIDKTLIYSLPFVVNSVVTIMSGVFSILNDDMKDNEKIFGMSNSGLIGGIAMSISSWIAAMMLVKYFKSEGRF